MKTQIPSPWDEDLLDDEIECRRYAELEGIQREPTEAENAWEAENDERLKAHFDECAESWDYEDLDIVKEGEGDPDPCIVPQKLKPVNPWYARYRWESFQEWSHRMMRYTDLVDAQDRLLGKPRARTVIEALESGIELELKKKAVGRFMSWLHEFCRPNPPRPADERMIGWPGRFYANVASYVLLTDHPAWHSYQKDLERARWTRRNGTRDRAQEMRIKRACKWLNTYNARWHAAKAKGKGAVDRLIKQRDKKLLQLPADMANRYTTARGDAHT